MLEGLFIGIYGLVILAVQIAIVVYVISLLRRVADGVERIEELVERSAPPRWPAEEEPVADDAV